MASTAEATSRPRKIAEAMVDESLSIQFMLNTSGDTLKAQDVEGFTEGKLITLSTKLAVQLDIANEELADMNSVLQHLGLAETSPVEVTESWSELLVRFLTNPMVAPLLMSLGMLGLFFEIKSPGFGVPGILGLVLLALFFGSHLLVGLADMTEMLILSAGIILILLEILVIPGFGIAGISGICLTLYAVFKMLIGNYPSPADYQSAYVGLTIASLAAFGAAVILYNTLPKTKLYQRIIPFMAQKKTEGYTISRGIEKLIGEKGTVDTDLRPAGKVIIAGEHYQAMSQGDFIEKGTEIIVDSTDENQLVVKKV